MGMNMKELSKNMKSRRKMRNFLLQPVLQLRIGLYSFFLAFAFCVALGAYLYYKLMQFTDVIVTLTEASEEVYQKLNEHLVSAAFTVIIGGVLFLAINLAISIYVTHRMVGPTIAFRRHIIALKNGNYESRVKLRLGDAFNEVADDLNNLSDVLSKRHR
jgi:hypothetical protein